MRQTLKKELTLAFEAPPPLRKKEFLQQFKLPKISTAEFIISQIGYIRKWIWGVSALIFGIALTGSVILSADMLWAISAFTPLLALTILSESGRSESYEMAELEMATRFSLRSVLFARLGILGVENLTLLCLMMPFGSRNNALAPVQAGAYIITPFLLTTFIGLYVVRKYRGHEAMYICSGITACISLSVFFSHMTFPQIYQGNYLIWWIGVILMLCIGTAIQCKKIVTDVSKYSASERRIT